MKTGQIYLVRPTLPSIWESYSGYKKAWRNLDINDFVKMRLMKILKTKFVFLECGGGSRWRMPFHAVEAYQLANKPLNEEVIAKLAKKAVEKFSKYGFVKLSDHELRFILAYLEIRFNRTWKNRIYSIEIADARVPMFNNRAAIIRTLRNTYSFRNTKENRNYCIEELFQEV